MTWTRDDGYTVTDDPARVDLDVVHGYLTHSYWSPGIARVTVARAMAHSLPFSLLAPDGTQVGYARVVTDYTSFGYLADVFVLEAHRGRGLATWLMLRILAHPELSTLRRWMLVTNDAHGLYRKVGFTAPVHPERIMEWKPPQNQPTGSIA